MLRAGIDNGFAAGTLLGAFSEVALVALFGQRDGFQILEGMPASSSSEPVLPPARHRVGCVANAFIDPAMLCLVRLGPPQTGQRRVKAGVVALKALGRAADESDTQSHVHLSRDISGLPGGAGQDLGEVEIVAGRQGLKLTDRACVCSGPASCGAPPGVGD
jgi:hypothetical protein